VLLPFVKFRCNMSVQLSISPTEINKKVCEFKKKVEIRNKGTAC